MRELVVALGLLFSACTPSPESISSIKIDKPIFAFNTKQVSELTIAKNEASSGDVWNARLIASRPGDPTSWEISSAPQGESLIDRRADGAFVEHLLDTLTTARAGEFAKNAPLTSFGLNPPFFGIRWAVLGASQEIQIGAPVKDGLNRYAFLPNEGKGDQRAVFVLQGALLQMLEYLKSFKLLRHTVLVTLTDDDVDELEIYLNPSSKRASRYAQRQGDDWADRKNKKLPAVAGELVKYVTHLRIQRFLDNPEENTRIAEEVRKKPGFKLVLKDRAGQPLEVLIADKDSKTWATVSSRAPAAFELYPGVIGRLKELSRF